MDNQEYVWVISKTRVTRGETTYLAARTIEAVCKNLDDLQKIFTDIIHLEGLDSIREDTIFSMDTDNDIVSMEILMDINGAAISKKFYEKIFGSLSFRARDLWVAQKCLVTTFATSTST